MSFIFNSTNKQITVPVLDRWIMESLAVKAFEGNVSEMLRSLVNERAKQEGITAENVLYERGLPVTLLEEIQVEAEVRKLQASGQQVLLDESLPQKIVKIKGSRQARKK